MKNFPQNRNKAHEQGEEGFVQQSKGVVEGRGDGRERCDGQGIDEARPKR